MKKILALVIVSMFSLNCMAKSITIYNYSPEEFTVEDYYGDRVNVPAGTQGTFVIKSVPENVIVTDNANRINSVQVIGDTTSITISSNYTVSRQPAN